MTEQVLADLTPTQREEMLMTNPTHFVEQFRYINRPDNEFIRGYLPQPIKMLSTALNLTAKTEGLKTVAIFKIKEKK